MALSKPIKQQNGLTLGYHRIPLLTVDVNQQCTILVSSYLDKDARQYEKDYAAGLINGEPQFPYTSDQYINIPYDEYMSVHKAYEWLKDNVSEFEGATDC